MCVPPAYVLAASGAKPWVIIAFIFKIDIRILISFPEPDGMIQNDRQDLDKPYGTSSTKS